MLGWIGACMVVAGAFLLHDTRDSMPTRGRYMTPLIAFLLVTGVLLIGVSLPYRRSYAISLLVAVGLAASLIRPRRPTD